MHKTARSQTTPPQRTGRKSRLGTRKKRAARRPASRLCGMLKDLPDLPDLPLERFLEAKTIWRVRECSSCPP